MNKVWLHNTKPIHPGAAKANAKEPQALGNKSFNQVLDTIVSNQDIKFSKHAIQRLASRNIHLNHNEMNRLNNGLNKATEKGIKETLILMDNKAFVASVKSKTIITAALDEQLKENVFTNIDGAVIV